VRSNPAALDPNDDVSRVTLLDDRRGDPTAAIEELDRITHPKPQHIARVVGLRRIQVDLRARGRWKGG
jgi:hypothetical protein